MHKNTWLGLLVFICILPTLLHSQNEIKGIVVDQYNKPMEGVNIFIENSLEGTSTDKTGRFELNSAQQKDTGIKIWFTYMGYKDFVLKVAPDVSPNKHHKIIMQYDDTGLEQVVVQGKRNRQTEYISTLNSIDLITTPNALGDVMAAVIRSYPGMQNNPQDGRFFVRGGDHYESKVFINDLQVHRPFSGSGPSIPSRGRFSPMLFEGVSFSTGGFGAEYGGAMSSILLLDTKSNVINDEYEVSVKSVGVDASMSRNLSETIALTTKLEYLNLAPYRSLFPSRYEWNEDFNVVSAELSPIINLKNGRMKSYNRFDITRFDYLREDIAINEHQKVNSTLKDLNFYSNNTFDYSFSEKLNFFAGMVYSINERDAAGIFSNSDESFVIDNFIQFKTKINYELFEKLHLTTGLQFNSNYYFIDYLDPSFTANVMNRGITNSIYTSFVDLKYKITPNFILKSGLRTDYSALLEENVVSPRFRLEYKKIQNLTIAPYYGDFYQNPRNGDLIFDFENKLTNEKANQFGINLYWEKDNRIIFIDAFSKKYTNLVKFSYVGDDRNPSEFNNRGYGTARGIDFFISDNQTFNNLEYRISYTYLDSERDYQNYPFEVNPTFYSKHNLSVNTQLWVNPLNSLLGLSYHYTSGRPYTNPNNDNGFLGSYIKPFQSLDFSFTYLISQNLFIHGSASNILGFRNVANYNYGNINQEGIYPEQKILPSADNFYFLGVFYTFGGKSAREKARDF